MTLFFPPGWTDDDLPLDRWGQRMQWPKNDMKAGNEPEWRAWSGARDRCHRDTHRAWKNYGARGIFMWKGWFMNFDAFLEHIGPRPHYSFSLDRIDNDRGYEPGNVRWADIGTQIANRRPRSRWVVSGGEVLNMPDLTPGQHRTAKAIATRMRAAEEKKAATLRERGWVVIAPEVAAAQAVAAPHRT